MGKYLITAIFLACLMLLGLMRLWYDVGWVFGTIEGNKQSAAWFAGHPCPVNK